MNRSLMTTGSIVITGTLTLPLSHFTTSTVILPDAIAAETGFSGVHALRFEGERFDCGSKSGYLQATVSFALARDDLRDELGAYLELVTTRRMAAE